ncbi:MAG TPA: ANTAR domain-containing protein [Mycobacterium sp.]|nr:ANTAR domain-containing protein [Mycobacterium sp.]
MNHLSLVSQPPLGQASSRQIIDVAIGVLIGLRGCSQREAFGELADAVRSSGTGLSATAQALVALASGTLAPSQHGQEAIRRWGHLFGDPPGHAPRSVI